MLVMYDNSTLNIVYVDDNSTAPTSSINSMLKSIYGSGVTFGNFVDNTVTVNGLHADDVVSFYVNKPSGGTASLVVQRDSSTSLKKAQADKIASLDTSCNTTILGGFTSSALGVSHQYGFGDYDQANLTGELSMMNADSTITSVDWKTTDAGVINHTKAQFIQVCKDGQTFKKNMISKYWTKKAQVNAATTVDQVNQILWNNTTPPSVPKGLTATGGTGQVALSWTANTDITMVGGGGYNVYEGTTKVNTSLVTSASYTATGLTSGSSHTYTVTAVDTDGNESSKSAIATATVI